MIGIWEMVVGMEAETNAECNDLAKLINLLQKHYGDKNLRAKIGMSQNEFASAFGIGIAA